MSEGKHTKLPWKIWDGENARINGFEIVAGTPVAELIAILKQSVLIPLEEQKANAVFIVKAANSHDQLMEVAKMACAHLARERGCEGRCEITLCPIPAALKAAGEDADHE